MVDGLIDHPVADRCGPVSFALAGDRLPPGPTVEPFTDWAATGEQVDLTVVHHGEVVWLLFRGDDASAVCLTDHGAGGAFFDT